MNLFGEDDKKKKALPKKTSTSQVAMFDKPSDSIVLSEYKKPAEKNKEIVEVKKVVRESRVSGESLRDLTDEERKIRFPNGPVSLKQLRDAKKRRK